MSTTLPLIYAEKYLQLITERVQKMDHYNQVEVLRILHGHGAPIAALLTETQHGNFINLSDLPAEVVGQIDRYVHYVQTQEQHLSSIERQTEEYRKLFAESAAADEN